MATKAASESNVALRRSSRIPKPSVKRQEADFSEKHKAISDAIKRQCTFNRNVEKRICENTCDADLMVAVTQSLDTIDDLFDSIRSDPLFKAEFNQQLIVTLDRLHQDRNTLVSRIKEQLEVVSTENVEPLHSMPDNCSHKSRSHVSASQASLGKTSKTSKSTSSASRLKEAAAHAQTRHLQLQAELEAQHIDDEMEELERQLKSKRREAEKRKIRVQMEVEKQKAEVLEAAAQDDDCKTSLLLLPQTTFAYQPGLASTPAVERRPPSVVHKSPGANEISAAESSHLAEVINASRMPVAEPFVFNGDPLKYNRWKKAFKAYTTRKALPDEEKLNFLVKYISQEVEEVISGYLEYDGDENFQEAEAALDERYGDSFTIAEAFSQKLANWPRIQPKDAVQTRKLADALKQCSGAMKSIPQLKQSMDDYKQIKQIVGKLPENMLDKWTAIVVSKKEKEARYPTFAELVTFVQNQATFLYASPSSNVNTNKVSEYSKTSGKGPAVGKTVNKTVRQTQSQSENTAQKAPMKPRPCLCCAKPNHKTADCYYLAKKTHADLDAFIRTNSLCYACLKPNHNSANCRTRATCKTCANQHPTVMHNHKTQNKPHTSNSQSQPNNTTPTNDKQNTQVVATAPEAETSDTPKVTTCISTQSTKAGLTSMALPVWLSTADNPDYEILVYALLDTMSDATFVAEDAVRQLETQGEPTKLTITTIASDGDYSCLKYSNLRVRGYQSSETITINQAYSQKAIPLDRAQIPTKEIASQWAHLAEVAAEIPSIQNCIVGLLLGFDTARALLPLRSVSSEDPSAPFAVQTPLGWSMVGRTGEAAENQARHCKRAAVETEQWNERGEARTDMSLTTNEQDHPMSQEDFAFLNIMAKGIHQGEDKFYSMPLPFKNNIKPILPDNKDQALKRLNGLRNKLKNNTQYCTDYVAFMTDIIDKGDAEPVLPNELRSQGRKWYIPHFGVYHPKKHKIRVVFDCAAKYKDTCINDHLIQGPDFMNNLVGVLHRFRKGQVAVMCDIQRMFHMFKVDVPDRDYLRFLWFKDENMEEIVEYRMTVHLFGAKSSPACATYGLRTVATDHEDLDNEYDARAVDFIKKDFYVDDGLLSVDSQEEAIGVIKSAVSICAKANVRLHKFISNDKEVLCSVPESEHAETLKDIDLHSTTAMPVERALGVQWCITNDEFRFKSNRKEQPATRRGILSTIASVFDPLGFLSPFILTGKNILQQICIDKLDWDEPLHDTHKSSWVAWKKELANLTEVKIPRCLKPRHLGTITHTELHHFSDASNSGLGQCSYLRLVDTNGNVHCALVSAKSRVISQSVTTPRAELMAAVLSSKMAAAISAEIDIKITNQYFWTDSKIVLGYLHNSTKRFHLFVANRVQAILSTSSANQWHYVGTNDNPADLASRGANIAKLMSSDWFQGPSFLWENDIESGLPCESYVLPEDDPEVKKSCRTMTCSERVELGTFANFANFSSLSSVVRAVCTLKRQVRHGSLSKAPPASVADLEEARLLVLKWVQQKNLTEYNDIKANTLNKRNLLAKVDPFIDEHGIARVGGRLKSAQLPYHEIHPVILPNKKHVTQLVIKHHHEKMQHQGKNLTIAEIRSAGYWMVGCSAAVGAYIAQCITCRRQRRPTETQQMSDLPPERTNPSPPFTYVGCDCFGPFIVKDNRKEVKRYGLIFTCMASRAVHLELLDDMTTDAFLNALRCFVAIRGPIRQLRSDQGTNFVGAANELSRAMKEGSPALTAFAQTHHFDFVFNPPHSSHMGGVWERQIRTVRNVLNTMFSMYQARVDTTTLRTFLYEVMAIVNSRPLAVLDNDISKPLTPNQLLTMKSAIVPPPPGQFDEQDVYSRKRWRQVQGLANTFWSRWKSDYLQTLQVRQKWQKHEPDISVDDIVLVKDASLTRNEWPLARVMNATKSKDGHVRKVQLLLADKQLTKAGKRKAPPSILDRPIHAVVLIQKSDKEVG